MKKIAINLLLLAAGAGVFSCGSSPKKQTPESQESAEAAEAAVQKKLDNELDDIYAKCRKALILEGAQSYTVVWKDTLASIAGKHYGGLTGVGSAGPSNGFYFPVIIAASGVKIPDPDLITPGTVLTVPDLEKNLAAPASREAIKTLLKDVAGIYTRKSRAASDAGQTEKAKRYSVTDNGLKHLSESF